MRNAVTWEALILLAGTVASAVLIASYAVWRICQQMAELSSRVTRLETLNEQGKQPIRVG